MQGAPANAGFPPLGGREKRDRTLPSYMDKNNEYGEKRYLILRSLEGKPLPKNPWIYSETIKRANGKVESGHAVDLHNYILETRSEKSFSELQKVNTLVTGEKIIIEPHPSFNSVKFVFTCSSISEMSTEEIKKYLEGDNVTDVYRFKKQSNGQQIQTNSYVVTMQAVRVPEYIYIGMERVKTRIYYPRPMRCNNCLMFGHTKKFCKKNQACSNCGGDFHENCSNPISCLNCKNPHNAFDLKCPFYQRETDLIKIKIDHNCSFREARTILQSHQKHNVETVASVVQQRLNTAQIPDPKDKIIEQLSQSVNKLQAEIAYLTLTITQLTAKKSDTNIEVNSSGTAITDTSNTISDNTTITNNNLPDNTNTTTNPKHQRSSSEETQEELTTTKKTKKKQKNS